MKTFHSVILLAITVCVTAFLVIALNKSVVNIILKVVITSVLFGLMNFANYNNSVMKFSAITQLVGLGMVLCFIGIRFNFVFCVIGHITNNLIAFVPFLLFGHTGPLVFHNSGYFAEIKEVPRYQLSQQQDYIGSDSIIISDNIEGIAVALAPFNFSTIYEGNIENLKKFRLSVRPGKEKTINQSQLFSDFIKFKHIKTDTLITKAFVFSITDSAKLGFKPKNGFYLTTLFGLTETIRKKFNIPLILNNNTSDYIFKMDIRFTRIKTFAEAKKFLKDFYGLDINEDKNRTARYIYLRE